MGQKSNLQYLGDINIHCASTELTLFVSENDVFSKIFALTLPKRPERENQLIAPHLLRFYSYLRES